MKVSFQLLPPRGKEGVVFSELSELQLGRGLDKSTACPHSPPTCTSFADVPLGHIQRGARVGKSLGTQSREAGLLGHIPGQRRASGFCVCVEGRRISGPLLSLLHFLHSSLSILLSGKKDTAKWSEVSSLSIYVLILSICHLWGKKAEHGLCESRDFCVFC